MTAEIIEFLAKKATCTSLKEIGQKPVWMDVFNSEGLREFLRAWVLKQRNSFWGKSMAANSCYQRRGLWVVLSTETSGKRSMLRRLQ